MQKNNFNTKRLTTLYRGIFSWRSLITFLILFTILNVAFVIYFLPKIKIRGQSVLSKTFQSSSNLFSNLNSNQSEKLPSDFNLLKENLFEAKLLLQGAGQDSFYWQIVNQKSTLSQGELIVDSAWQILDSRDTLSMEKDKLIGDDRSIALKNVRESLEVYVKKVRQKLAVFDTVKLGFLVERQDIDQKIRSLLQTFSSVDLINSEFKWVTAEDGGSRRYLLAFQNNSELRGASGGSLGSFAIASIDQGIMKINFGQNIFKIDNAYRQSDKTKQEAPSELQFLTKEWVMKDAGWSIDGQEALSNIEKYYELETGEQIDGVITVDYSVVRDLLKVTGPIEMPDYGVTLTAENFKKEIEQEVHQDYFEREGGTEENEPKKIIGEMMPIFIDRLIGAMADQDKALLVAGSFAGSIKNKDILFYFDKGETEEIVKKLNIGGTVLPYFSDYLYITNSNVDGFKSSTSMREKLTLNVKIDDKGEASSNLIIDREHNGTDEWPDGRNKNFVRLALPANTELTGFSPLKGNFQQFFDQGYRDGKIWWTTEESGKKIINFWLSTEPGESSQVGMSYKTGIKYQMEGDGFLYELHLQKQPGAPNEEVEIKINYPVGFRPVNVKSYDERQSFLTLNLNLKNDQDIKIMFEKVKLLGN